MRASWCAVWVMALTATGQAAPVPQPPPDFAGGQYIDGDGCVFLRDGSGWVPRLDRSGAAICGFPPTLSSRRTDPDSERVLHTAQEESQPSAEDILIETLASGLRQGEFNADPAPVAERRDPPILRRNDPVTDELGQLVAQQAALRGVLSGAAGSSSRLCDLLGYQPVRNAAPILGGDVTQGLCAGMRAPVPEERIIEVGKRDEREKAQVASSAGPETKRYGPPGAASVAADRRTDNVVSPTRKSDPAQAASSALGRQPAHRSAEAQAPTVEMIPASARYVQIGGYADDGNAVSAIRKLSAMGFRVAQRRDRDGDRVLRVILAGPFTDRRDLVEALNRLRDSGYPKAVAR